MTVTQSKVDKEEAFSESVIVSHTSIYIDNIVSASVELFGLVIEYKNRMQIILSDNETLEIETPKGIVNWRTFPRSMNYTNQLHLIFEDRLEILSINHDFLVDQNKKLFGIRYTEFDFNREKIDE